MDFAKRQLEKYGWCEGEGLGKNATGIKEALKPKVKLNSAGIGHDPAKEFTDHWWEDVFNSAASNIDIKNAKTKVKFTAKIADSDQLSSFDRMKRKKDKLKYQSFIKCATLENSTLVMEPEACAILEAELEKKASHQPALTDEELFAACGGLTAHKAARHGHKLSGKLKRLKEQEEMAFKTSTSVEKRLNSAEKSQEYCENDTEIPGNEGKKKRKRRKSKNNEISNVSNYKKKKLKKRKKDVQKELGDEKFKE